MNELIALVAFVAVIIGTLVFVSIICGIALTAYYYAEGRKTGGYPIFARARRHVDFSQYVYNRGLKKSRDKIAKGGYR